MSSRLGYATLIRLRKWVCLFCCCLMFYFILLSLPIICALRMEEGRQRGGRSQFDRKEMAAFRFDKWRVVLGLVFFSVWRRALCLMAPFPHTLLSYVRDIGDFIFYNRLMKGGNLFFLYSSQKILENIYRRFFFFFFKYIYIYPYRVRMMGSSISLDSVEGTWWIEGFMGNLMRPTWHREPIWRRHGKWLDRSKYRRWLHYFYSWRWLFKWSLN